MPWKAIHIDASAIYNNKLEYKCTLILLNAGLLCIGPIQAKGHLSYRDTYLDSHNYKRYLSSCK